MKVSIVTACFNAAATVEETLHSVLDQEGVELEYLVIDGASTDGTAEIIRHFEPRLAYFVSEPDRGQVDALNKGFARATGDVLGFLNADDVFTPGALRAVCDAFAAAPEREIVRGTLEWIDFTGAPLGPHRGEIDSLADVLDVFRVWWADKQWVQPEVFFRRSLKERVGGFDPQYHLAFDYDFWVRCFLEGARVTPLERPLVRFRRHANQKSVDTARGDGEIRDILAEHLRDPRVPPALRRRLAAELSYDRYQTAPAAARPSFIRALLREPRWLTVPAVRQRLLASFFDRSKKPTR